MKTKCLLALFIALLLSQAMGGLISYGICQTGCNVLAVTCFAGAGATMGVATGGAAVPAAVLACSKAQGVCMAACWVAVATPL